jgi:hypothetical protein
VAVAGAVEGGAERGQFALPADEGPARQAVERVGGLAQGRLRGRQGQKAHRGERVAHGAGVRRPLARRLREQPEDERIEPGRDGRVQPRRCHRSRVDVLRDDRDGVVPHERWPAGQHLVQHGAEGVEVGPRVSETPERLLGRHVRDRADHRPLAGESRTIECHSQAEVGDLHLSVLAEEHVPRLEIAVDDAALVRVLEPPADLVSEADRLHRRKSVPGGAREEIVHRPARDVLHDDVDLVLVFADVVDRDHLRMIAEAGH